MAGWVLADSTTIDGVVYTRGTTPPDDVAARCGEHLRRYVGDGGSSVEEVVEPTPAPLVLPDPDRGGGAFYVEPPAEDAAAVEGADPEVEQAEVPPAGSIDQGAPDDVPQAQAATPEDGPRPPPQAGRGSSEAAWRAYAKQVGVHVDDAETRADVIATLEAAGKPI